MRRLSLLLGVLLFAVIFGLAIPAYASHSAAGGVECGTLERHLEDDYTKGTSDAQVYHIDVVTHERGCEQHLIMSNLVGAGIGEPQGNLEQSNRCVRDGRRDAEWTFRYYFDLEIDASSVKVDCSNYGRRS